MPPENAPAGTPCWMDLVTTDVEAAREFYPALFGWTAAEPSAEFGGYFMFLRDETPVAGCMPMSAGEDPANDVDVWGVYLSVDDASEVVAAAEAAGAAIRQSPLDIADLGRSALLIDPGGARVGVWEAKTFPGFGAIGPLAANGGPAYFELHTRDYDACLAFYANVFGWNVQQRTEVPGMRYATLGGGDASAGIMDATNYFTPVDPSWHTYIAVADVDACAAEVTRLGGTLAHAPQDTPFGRHAFAADPAGAPFHLLGPNVG